MRELPTVPRILVAPEGEKVPEEDAEAFAYIHRPFTPIEVLDLLRLAVESGEYIREERPCLEVLLGESARELMMNSQWLTAILDNLPYGLLLVSNEGRVIRANDGFLALSKIESIEGSGLWSEIAPWNRFPQLAEAFAKCLDRGEAVKNILELEDGGFLEALFVPVMTNSHSAGVMMLFRDVTSDEASRHRLNALVDIFDEGIVILDREYKFVWANEIFQKMFGVGEGFIGQLCRTFFKEKTDFCKGCTVKDTFESGVAQRCFQIVTLDDGSVRTFEILTGPIRGSEGEISEVIEIIRDVSDRERVVSALANTKERLENTNVQLTRRIDELAMLMELSDALQAVDNLDENLHIFLTSVTAYEGCGFNRAFLFLVDRDNNSLVGRYAVGSSNPEEAGRIWRELASHEVKSFSEALATYRKAVADSDMSAASLIRAMSFDLADEGRLLVKALRDVSTRIYKNARSDPESRDFAELINSDSFAVIPLFAMGRPVGVLVVDNIITKEQITEEGLRAVRMLAGHASLAIERGILTSQIADQYEKLQTAYAKLRENQELLLRTEKLSAIGKLAAQMAHEIRNPLVSIGGFARNIAKHAPEGSNILRGASIILEETNRLEGIVDDVLSYSRGIKPNRKNADFNGLIARTLEMIEDQLQKSNIEVEVEFDEAVGEIVVDADQIRQVFLNLFKNAISAMPDGGKLRITTKSLGGFVWIEVTDTGVGIPGDYKNKIFEPFFTTKSSGTGLGLSITYQIIEAHSGMIWFTSQPDVGTTFNIKLPQERE